MKRAVRVLCLVIALTFAVTMALAGCGSKTTEQSAPSTDTASSAAESTATAAAESTTPAEEQLPPVELSWYHPGTPQNDTTMVEEELNKYLADKINATIKINTIVFGTYQDKMSVMIASGDNMDIMFTASWMGFLQNQVKGAYLDITDLLPKYCPDTVANIDPNFFDGAKVGGHIYSIPTQKELAHNYGLLYRADLAQKYNMDLSTVKTWTDVEPFLKTIKEKEPDVTPLGAYYKTESYLQTLLNLDPVGDSNLPGKLLTDGSTKVVNEYALPEAKQYMDLYRKWFLAGYIRKDAATNKDEDSDRKGGKIFMLITTLKPLVNEEWTSSYGFDYAQLDVTKPYVGAGDALGSMQAVSRTSKNPERALMLLELVNTDPFVNNTINYGVEGKHYVKVSDNVIDYPSGVTAQNSGYNPNLGWVFGNQFLNYLFKGTNPEKWAKFKEYNASATPSKLMGFQLDQEPIKTELAACSNVIAQYVPGLNVGAVDPDKILPKFLEALKGAGIDKVIAEKQKQIDAFLAK